MPTRTASPGHPPGGCLTTGRAIKQFRATSRVVRSGPVDLAVRHMGDEGPSLVVVHGLGDTQRSWDRVVHHLASRFRLVTYDLRGHGRSSSGGPYAIDTLVADLAAVIDNLGVPHPLLVGHSLGALVAAEYAAAHTCAGLIGVEGGLALKRPPMDWEDLAAHAAKPASRLMSRALISLGLGSRLSVAEMRHLTEDVERHERQLGQAYRRMQCPMLVLLGTKPDRIPGSQAIREAVRTSAERIRLTHPEVEISWLDSGHMIPLQRPRELASLIIDFAAASQLRRCGHGRIEGSNPSFPANPIPSDPCSPPHHSTWTALTVRWCTLTRFPSAGQVRQIETR